MLTSLIVPAFFFVPLVRQKPYVRFDDRETREIGAFGEAPTSVNLEALSICSNAAAAWHDGAAPGGGTLSPLAFANSASIDGAGRALCFSDVVGVTRNQGVWRVTIDCRLWTRDPGFAAPNNVSLSNALEYVVGPQRGARRFFQRS